VNRTHARSASKGSLGGSLDLIHSTKSPNPRQCLLSGRLAPPKKQVLKGGLFDAWTPR